MAGSVVTMQGIIIKGVGGLHEVRDLVSGALTPCRARGKFRRIQAPLPGDLVVYAAGQPEGVIDEIHPRRNELIRPAIANITQAFLVFALAEPDINWNLLDHFLLVMEQKGIRPLILFNKIDLAPDARQAMAQDRFLGTNYEIRLISALNEAIREELIPRLREEVTVLVGPSGAGKSTLLNQLLGEQRMETGIVSERIKRGKHTTRHTELVVMGEGLLADTPGFSNIEPQGIDYRQLKDLFPEFRPHEGECRFNGCLHDREPGCAVKGALGTTVSQARYDYYQYMLTKLKEEDKHKWD